MTKPYASLPLDHRAEIKAASGDIALSPLPFSDRRILRADEKGLEKAGKALGVKPPAPGQMSVSESVRVTWLSPDEWLIDLAADLSGGVSEALAGTHYQLVDVSDYYVGMSYSGPKTRDALAKLATRDLREASFPAGSATSLILGQAQVILQCDPDRADTFVVIVRLSYADYLWCLLADAGMEYGLSQQSPIGGEPLRGLGLTRIS